MQCQIIFWLLDHCGRICCHSKMGDTHDLAAPFTLSWVHIVNTCGHFTLTTLVNTILHLFSITFTATPERAAEGFHCFVASLCYYQMHTAVLCCLKGYSERKNTEARQSDWRKETNTVGVSDKIHHQSRGMMIQWQWGTGWTRLSWKWDCDSSATLVAYRVSPILCLLMSESVMSKLEVLSYINFVLLVTAARAQKNLWG